MSKENTLKKQYNSITNDRMTVKQYNGKAPNFPIQNVADNNEKNISYQKYFDQYKKAKEYEFYLECLWILYAMIEDRTSTFLYDIGFTSKKKITSVTETKKIKKDIREIFALDNKNNIRYKFNSLGGKFTRIKELLTWCKVEHETLSEYQKALIKIMQPVVNSSEFKEALDYLDSEWRDKRNQLVHALFNKNPAAVWVELLPLVENGYRAAIQLNKGVEKVEDMDKEYNIRLIFKIQ